MMRNETTLEGRVAGFVPAPSPGGANRAAAVIIGLLAVAGSGLATGPAALAQAQTQAQTQAQRRAAAKGDAAASAAVATAEMAAAARAFLNALDDEQKAKAVFPWDSDERENWHYVPLDRQGVMLKHLRPDQKHLAYALLASGMSTRGYVKALTIMSLEQILFEMENQNPTRDTEKYYFAVFGEPSAEGTWGWRVEGHHLSVNFTLVGGETIVAMPSFFGTNPGEVREGPRAGLRVLGPEEDAARELAVALKEAGKAQVVFAESPPEEILTGQDRVAKPLDAVGVRAAEMNGQQKRMLRRLIAAYARRHRGEIAAADLKKIDDTGFADVRFAWAGSLEVGKAHYYRVQGATFLIEYANTQNNANHAHAVWRSPEGDFGRDVLAEHFKSEHAQ